MLLDWHKTILERDLKLAKRALNLLLNDEFDIMPVVNFYDKEDVDSCLNGILTHSYFANLLYMKEFTMAKSREIKLMEEWPSNKSSLIRRLQKEIADCEKGLTKA